MLFLVFHLGEDRYMLDVRQVAEILPLVDIMALPQSPPGVAGIFNYCGELVPAVDLSQIMLGRPAQRRLHTRIVLVRYNRENSTTQLLGLIVERVTDTKQLQESDFSAPGVSAPQLGPVITDQRGLAQRIEVEQLLPASVRELLCHQPVSCR